MIVCPLHWYYSADHLAEVQDEMAVRGPPRLRGYMDDEAGVFLLREGTHRIRSRVAARTRGLAFDAVTLER